MTTFRTSREKLPTWSKQGQQIIVNCDYLFTASTPAQTHEVFKVNLIRIYKNDDGSERYAFDGFVDYRNGFHSCGIVNVNLHI